jgi:hypothetical protein
MKKQTKMLLGLGIVAVAGYLYWKSKQTKTTTKSFSGVVGNVYK